jgi:4-hydroxybenzoate polyprenyltransferase
VLAALSIIAQVVIYRLRKLEMANMAAAASIAVALHLDVLDVGIRIAFAFLLNALVYLNNDYIDVGIDLNSSDKDTAKARYLADNMSAALWAQILMTAMLCAGAVVYDVGLLVPILIGGGVCWWYSAYLKRRPFVDVLAMMVWGVTMPLCGVPLGSTLGWLMAVQLGLFSGVFESIQVMRDAEDDAEESDVRTTGVVLGVKRTHVLARGIMVSVTAYAALAMHPIAALLSAGAFLVPFSEDDIAKYWTRVKLVYGVTWLFICAWVFIQGQTSGLLWSMAISPLDGK